MPVRHFARRGDLKYLFPLTDAEKDAGLTKNDIVGGRYREGHVLRYGTNTTPGTTDMSGPANNLAKVIKITGGTATFPAEAMHFGSQVTFTAPSHKRFEINGFGCEITTEGEISGLKIVTPTQNHGCVVRGIKINHRGNSDATSGFHLQNAFHCSLVDCTVEAHGVSATYAAYHIEWEDDTDATTGSFWNKLVRCSTRKRSGSDVGDITRGVLIEDNSNATIIDSCEFSNVTTGVEFVENSSSNEFANAVVIIGTAFETYTTAIKATVDSATNLIGLRVNNCRFESGTTVFDFDDLSADGSNPPEIWGNHYSSNAGTILANTNGVWIDFHDYGITPTLPQAQYRNDNGFLFAADASGASIQFRPIGGTGAGYELLDNGGASIRGWLHWVSGGNCEIGATALLEVILSQNNDVKITSGTGTPEGAVTAGVGSLYLRSDGGAGTTLYVKESGTGNTGWIAMATDTVA